MNLNHPINHPINHTLNHTLNHTQTLAIKQAMLIPLLALVNIFIGVFVSDYSIITQHISELALKTPLVAYTHRLVDVLIGISMCIFALSCLSLAKAKFTFLTMFAFGLTWIFAGIFILTSPLHDVYGLTTVLIVVPVLFALEMPEFYGAKNCQTYCVLTTLIHVVFFWFFSYGFMPIEYKGMTQRIWVAITLVWYGIAAYQMLVVANQNRQS